MNLLRDSSQAAVKENKSRSRLSITDENEAMDSGGISGAQHNQIYRPILRVLYEIPKRRASDIGFKKQQMANFQHRITEDNKGSKNEQRNCGSKNCIAKDVIASTPVFGLSTSECDKRTKANRERILEYSSFKYLIRHCFK